MKEKTKGVILKQKGTKIGEDGEDWNRLEMTILKSSANFFKMHEWWRSSFKMADYEREGSAQKVQNWAYCENST